MQTHLSRSCISVMPVNTKLSTLDKIKVLTALVGRLSLSVGWENGPELRLKTVSFNLKLPVI